MQSRAAGVVFDFESLPAGSLGDYRTLLREARTAWAPLGKLVTATVPVGDPDWKLKAFAGATDRLFLMDYDQHWQGCQPGPIAAHGWFSRPISISYRGEP